MKIDVYPENGTDAVRLKIEDFELNAEDCHVCVYKYNNKQMWGFTKVYVPPDIYQEWGRDDNYIVDYVLDALGFVRKPEFTINFPI